MEELLKLILEEYIFLVPVLYLIGYIMKKSEKVKDTNIPWALTIIGVVLGVIVAVPTANFATWQTAMADITKGIFQGALVTGATVLANQIKVQANKAKEETK